MSATEFPAGSRWRHRTWRNSVIVYGEAGGIVAYRSAERERPRTLRADLFLLAFERIEHPEEPKDCPYCGGTGHGQYPEDNCKHCENGRDWREALP